MGLLKKLSWFVLFFGLFAFALNNQQTAVIHWFFGMQWQGPMVFVVLVVFGLGCLCGVLAMTPHWWQSRRKLALGRTAGSPNTATDPAQALTTGMPPVAHPPRDGV